MISVLFPERGSLLLLMLTRCTGDHQQQTQLRPTACLQGRQDRGVSTTAAVTSHYDCAAYSAPSLGADLKQRILQLHGMLLQQCTSTLPGGICLPSGEKHSLATALLWPFSSRTHCPVVTSQMRMEGLLPACPAAKWVPQQDQARHSRLWLLVVDRSCLTCWFVLVSCITAKLLAAVAHRCSAVGQAASTALEGVDSA